MAKPMSKAGAALRRAIRADLDASPSIDHLELRRKHKAAEGIVESAMTKTVAEWDAIIAAIPDDAAVKPPRKQKEPRRVLAGAPWSAARPLPPAAEDREAGQAGTDLALGIEQGFVKFARKPAKMGMDFIFWVPRVYVKNGLVDPKVEYDVFLKKKQA